MSLPDSVSSIADADELSAEQLSLLSPEEIKCLVYHLKDEADRHWNIDAHESVKIAEKIQRIGTLTDNLSYLALGTMALGDAKKLVGQPHEAWQLLGEAGQIYKQIKDDVGWARTRIGRLFISPDVDCVDEAIADAAKARTILSEAGQKSRCIWLDMNLGTVYNRIGDTHQALHHYHTAFQLAEQLGTSGEEYLWPILYNLAVTDVEIGRIKEAAAHYDRAIDIAVAREETRNAMYAMTGRGYLSQLQGKYREALLLLSRAEALTQAETSLERLFARRIIVECYLHLNRNLDARNIAQEVVAGFEGQGMLHEAARTRFHLATVEANLGNYEAALQAMDQAQGILGRSGNSIWLARQQVQRAKVLLKLGATDDAHQLLQRALKVFEPGCLNFAVATLLKGEISLADGLLEQAREMAEEALTIARKLKSLDIRYGAYTLLGRIAETCERPRRAARFYHAAVASLERSYRHLTITLRPGFLEDKSEALRALIRIQLTIGNIAAAYRSLERAKSLVLLGYLANRDSLKWQVADLETAHLLDELNQLREEHNFFYHRVFADFDTTQGDKFPSTYVKATDELKTRECRIREITEQLYILNEQTALIEDSALPSLEDVQNALSAKDVLIEYFNDGEWIWAFVVDDADIRVRRMPQSLTNVDGLINKLQANLDWALATEPKDPLSKPLTARFQQITLRLHDALVGPLANLIDGYKQLVIVPYGALHYLPFNTLFDGDRYLIEKHEIVIMPASGLLPRRIIPRTGGARVLAHSWNGKLPKTHVEAQTVNRLLGGEIYLESEAQRAILNKPPLKVLHLAAHGEYRFDVPELSYIHLADGHLFFDDALQADLSYELVVLSGCETGRANITPGDEVIGLGRGFLYAGAGAIIASLWHVDDTLSHTLMKRFYEHLAAGDSKARSVRAAQQELLWEDFDLHPAFWGTFQLIGDSSPLSTV
jgi:CHAT domain-containing protein